MYLYIGMILLICVLLFVLILLFRKAKAEKICKMSCPQKLQIIENLVFPFGDTPPSMIRVLHIFIWSLMLSRSILTTMAAPGSSSSGKVSTDFTPAARSASIVLTAF